jgi:hypothetical protein
VGSKMAGGGTQEEDDADRVSGQRLVKKQIRREGSLRDAFATRLMQMTVLAFIWRH